MLTQWGLRLSLKRLRSPTRSGCSRHAACRRRGATRSSRRIAAPAPRLRRPGATHQTVRRSLAQRRALQGRIADAALGRDRSRPTGLAADQPLAASTSTLPSAMATTPPSAPSRKVLIAAWHVLARNEPFKPSRPRARDTPVSASSSMFPALTALHGIEKSRQLPRTLCDAPSAEREMSTPTSPNGSTRPATVTGPDHKAHPDGRPP